MGGYSGECHIERFEGEGDGLNCPGHNFKQNDYRAGIYCEQCEGGNTYLIDTMRAYARAVWPSELHVHACEHARVCTCPSVCVRVCTHMHAQGCACVRV
jgi:hypothetical protein